jgi:NAD(P)-dependent dehydrogenase (short-subunit alcohol dehydrogenase family)
LVAIGSIAAASEGLLGLLAYEASKAALRSLFLNLHLELAGRNVRSSIITPGLVDTELGLEFARNVNLDATDMLATKDVADAVWFLANYSGKGNIGEIVLQPCHFSNRDQRVAWTETMERAKSKALPFIVLSVATMRLFDSVGRRHYTREALYNFCDLRLFR